VKGGVIAMAIKNEQVKGVKKQLWGKGRDEKQQNTFRLKHSAGGQVLVNGARGEKEKIS